MRAKRHGDPDDPAIPALDADATKLLTPKQERRLLRELGECKRKLADALARIPGAEPPPRGADDPQSLSAYIAQSCAGRHDGPAGARLGAIYRRYCELRWRLALANVRLVAHVAKRFRDRGIAHSDLLQEGFCGLLEAIDRFDTSRDTKLSTYATWWVRQAMQLAVASGAYPVRLNPRHLRQLAQSQDELDGLAPAAGEAAPSAETVRRIHAATRPTVSLDATLDGDGGFSLLQTMSDPEGDRTGDVDRDEAVGRLLGALRPREQQILALRFGLGGKPRLSLSQVGEVMEVSKERVRQIQDRALEKLRALVDEEDLLDALVPGG